MLTFSVEQYIFVVQACRNGELSQEQALVDINKKYKATQKYIRRKKTDIMKKHGFFKVVSGGIDELISIHDRTMNQAFEPEIENYLNIYRKIVNDFLSANELNTTQKLDFDMAMVAINEERSKIADLCSEERNITEYYERSIADIMEIKPKINTSDYEQHYFMQILKNDARQAFEVMKKAIEKGLVEYTSNGYFNFKCDKGCVGLFFAEAGYTDYKRINQHILINGENSNLITLQNAKKNTPPQEWEQEIKRQFF